MYILNVLAANKCTQRTIIDIACTRLLLITYGVPLIMRNRERCPFSYCSPPLEKDYMIHQMEYVWTALTSAQPLAPV